jgi:hypothetical protein
VALFFSFNVVDEYPAPTNEQLLGKDNIEAMYVPAGKNTVPLVAIEFSAA